MELIHSLNSDVLDTVIQYATWTAFGTVLLVIGLCYYADRSSKS